MRDDNFTDPALIRASYQARGRNAKANMSKAESLGVNASSVSPTSGVRNSGGVGGGGVVSSGGSGTISSGGVTDPTYYGDPGVTYDGGTFEGSLYKQDPIDDGSYQGIV